MEFWLISRPEVATPPAFAALAGPYSILFAKYTSIASGAIYATKKATELGGKVVALSDSNGYIYDPDGIELDVVISRAPVPISPAGISQSGPICLASSVMKL